MQNWTSTIPASYHPNICRSVGVFGVPQARERLPFPQRPCRERPLHDVRRPVPHHWRPSRSLCDRRVHRRRPLHGRRAIQAVVEVHAGTETPKLIPATAPRRAGVSRLLNGFDRGGRLHDTPLPAVARDPQATCCEAVPIPLARLRPVRMGYELEASERPCLSFLTKIEDWSP